MIRASPAYAPPLAAIAAYARPRKSARFCMPLGGYDRKNNKSPGDWPVQRLLCFRCTRVRRSPWRGRRVTTNDRCGAQPYSTAAATNGLSRKCRQFSQPETDARRPDANRQPLVLRTPTSRASITAPATIALRPSSLSQPQHSTFVARVTKLADAYDACALRFSRPDAADPRVSWGTSGPTSLSVGDRFRRSQARPAALMNGLPPRASAPRSTIFPFTGPYYAERYPGTTARRPIIIMRDA